MTTLYDFGAILGDTVERIQDLLAEGVSADDERVQELLEQMVAQEDDWENKAINVAKYLNQLSKDEAMIDAEILRLTNKRKNISNAYSNLSGLLMWQMENFGKLEIKDSLLSVKIRENPISVVVKYEDAIPSQFKATKTTTTVNKNALKLAFKEGAKIEGVEFVRTKKLAIK